MGGIFKLFLLLGTISLVCSDNEHGTNSLTYSNDNFDTEVMKKPHFVMFFAPWCGHCKRLGPTWDELAKKFNSDPDNAEALIAKVDCTVDTAVCSKYEVSGYPTLKFFNLDTTDSVRYKGSRELAALEKFVVEQLSGPEEVAPSEGEPSTAENGLHTLTQETYNQHVEHGLHFVKFYAPWCGHCQRLAPTWEELAKVFENEEYVTIAKVDCTENRDICQNNGIQGYPTLLLIKDGQKLDKYQGPRELGDLQQFVEARKDQLEEPAKEEIDGQVPTDRTDEAKPDVLDLTEDNFDESIQVSTAFVKFFAPWCGHCKRMAPAWEDLGKKFADNENVVIGKVDCTVHRGLCEKYEVRGFPSLLLFRHGVKETEHNGGRDVDALYNFVIEKVPHDEL